MPQYLSQHRAQADNSTFAIPPVIGSTHPNAGFFTTLSVSQLRVGIKKVTTDYTVTNQDFVILCDASDAPLEITLPSPVDSSGRTLNVKKIDSSDNLVTVMVQSAMIDGSSSYDIKYAMSAINVVSDGDNYFVI